MRCIQAIFLNDYSKKKKKKREDFSSSSCFMAPHLAIGNSVFSFHRTRKFSRRSEK
jgi:hypothetical protein